MRACVTSRVEYIQFAENIQLPRNLDRDGSLNGLLAQLSARGVVREFVCATGGEI